VSKEAPVKAEPRAENGILYVAPEWNEAAEGLVRGRWPEFRIESLHQAITRIDLSRTPRGACPGFNDEELLGLLSRTGPPGVMVVGFFCDSIGGAEGARVFEAGRQVELRRVEWAGAPSPDPIAWPISTLAMSLRLPIEAITRVARPQRPELAVSVESLLMGQDVDAGEPLNRALEALGFVPLDEATAALVKHLGATEWVTRFHAARAYARSARGQGHGDKPTLQSLLDDEDESVREATLDGIAELIGDVAFSDEGLLTQIDAAIKRGLADDDEDVREVAESARDLRTELLG
jgi:hypothetical protein